jgi:tyrosyl-tRNA synthetase
MKERNYPTYKGYWINEHHNINGAENRAAKKVMAFEVTKLVLGEEEAVKVKQASEALFAGANNLDNVPSYYMNRAEFANGIDLAELMVRIQLATSKSEVRRLLEQGGIYLNNLRVTEMPKTIGEEDIVDNAMVLRKGKKSYMKVVVD